MAPGRTMKKCPGIGVRVRILMVLHEHGAQHPTRLARMSELSYDVLQTCLNSLEKNGLVTITDKKDGHVSIRITNKGVGLLKDYLDNLSRLTNNE